jgi:hypothetical protein
MKLNLTLIIGLFFMLTNCKNEFYRYSFKSKERNIEIYADVIPSSDKKIGVVLNVYFINIKCIDSVKVYNPKSKHYLYFDSKLEGTFVFTDLEFDSLVENNFLIVSLFLGKNKQKYKLKKNKLKETNTFRGH